MSAPSAAPRCPLCGVSRFRPLFSKKGRQFYRCQSCALEVQWPLPTLADLADFYDRSFADGLYREFAAADAMKRMTARQRIKEVRRQIPVQGRWLDVGCANGVFVETVAGEGVTAEGVDLSQYAVQAGRDRGLQLHWGTIDDLPADACYDCITAFDVLEHVLQPGAFLERIYDRLVPGGHVVLTVPNTGGIVRRLMGRRWYFYIPEEHLHYFNRGNLGALLGRHGFAVRSVGATYKPMTFDYAQTQFAEYNPLIHRLMTTIAAAVPAGVRSRPLPLPIGEIRIIGQKPVSSHAIPPARTAEAAKSMTP